MELRSHIIAIPCPAQGHVIPMMELSQCLVQHGFKITFVNTDYNHDRVFNASLDDHEDYKSEFINLVSIPDGLEPWEDRNDPGRLTQSLYTVALTKLEELINKINESEDDKITCMIADVYSGWALQVANKMKLPAVAFSPSSAAMLLQIFHVDNLIRNGIIDQNGTPLKNQKFRLAPNVPAMSITNLLWTGFDDEITTRILFDSVCKTRKILKSVDRIFCNSVYDLEPGVFTSEKRILPIGPLVAKNQQGYLSGSFWRDDTNCLKWLDQQQPKSVIYVAFGSLTILNKNQFQELSLGLELTGKPFLWVVRRGITKEPNVYPNGYTKRVANRGKFVEWAPQQKGTKSPFCGMLFEPLWLELDHGSRG